jgi:3-dehydroquinate dehydratase-1
MSLDTSEPLIVGCVTSELADEAVRAAEAGADAVELRMDLYDGGAEEALRDLESHAAADDPFPVIATNRSSDEGGEWSGDEDARIELLCDAAAHADAIDVEFSAEDEGRVRAYAAAEEAGATTICSFHDFGGTPGGVRMVELVDEMAEEADVAKLAVTPDDHGDVLGVLELVYESDVPVCAIAMGAIGSYSRVVAPALGSRLTYGALDDATAPGQLTVEQLASFLETFGVR